jgi:hypothetical protein
VPGATAIAATARRIPWRRVLAVSALAYQRGSAAWAALTPDERRRLRELIAKSRGRPSNLTERERGQIRELAAKALHGARHGR